MASEVDCMVVKTKAVKVQSIGSLLYFKKVFEVQQVMQTEC